MDPRFTVSPVHAEVSNHLSYSLQNALGSPPARLKPHPNDGTFQVETEVANSSSHPYHPGQSLAGCADQPYLSDIAAEHIYVRTRGVCNDVYSVAQGTNQGPVSASAHLMNIDYLESHDEYSNRRIQHQSNTLATLAVTGLTEAGNRTSQANPPSVSQKNNYDNCKPKECLYQGADGTPCSQEITCANVSEHFVSHGIKNLPHDEMILCRWEGCSEEISRKNFVRHVRGRHLGHVRGTGTHSSEKERRYRAS